VSNRVLAKVLAEYLSSKLLGQHSPSITIMLWIPDRAIRT